MSLAPWYVYIKSLHIGLISASGVLFFVRGVAVLTGQHWPMRKPWCRLSYAIDTLLLSAGVTLWAILSLGPIQNPWLGTKLLLLLLYIVLGSLALKRAPIPWHAHAAIRSVAADAHREPGSVVPSADQAPGCQLLGRAVERATLGACGIRPGAVPLTLRDPVAGASP